MERIRPETLKVGDKVGVVAPAKYVEKAGMDAGIALLTSWGLQVVEGQYLYETHGYLAGEDRLRRSDLQHMLDNPEIKAIFCARGGYGTNRIIDALNFASLANQPKWLIGFSDITALHLRFFGLGIESIHGAMPLFFDTQNPASLISLKHLLFEHALPVEAPHHGSNILGTADGPIVGGNLSMIVDSIDTPSEVPMKGCIMFIEEIGEELYKLDKMVLHLKRAGILSGLAGLAVGQMSGMKDTTIPFGQSIENIVLNHVSEYGYPVCFDFPVGHDSLNLAIPVGRNASFEVNKKGAMMGFKK